MKTKTDLTPKEIVEQLDRHIVGQHDAKRAVAIALRNRWRWCQLPQDIRKEVTPKNIIMIGPTGVGKTEITRRLADLIGVPFVKVEATKYTEVGYYGRDVESMVRDLVESAINLIKVRKKREVQEQAEARVEDRLIDLLLPTHNQWEDDTDEVMERHKRNREKMRSLLAAGDMEDRKVELSIEKRTAPVQIFSNMGMEQMDVDFQNMFDKIMPKQQKDREVTVKEARELLLEQESEALMDQDAIQEEAIRLAEDNGIIFIDEIDKVCGPEESGRSNADVSRQGVQRDMLPIVEGTTVQTKYGNIRTDQILFIAAGAFHRTKPSDLMPELQGRFPIRVELTDLTRDDFLRILTEPTGSLTKQYTSLLEIDGVKLEFKTDGLEVLADIAFEVNQTSQNIGARRLHTMMEKLLEEISYEAPADGLESVTVNAEFVQDKLRSLIANEDLSKFIL